MSKPPNVEAVICSRSEAQLADEYLSDKAVNVDWGTHSGCLHRIKMSDRAAEFVTS